MEFAFWPSAEAFSKYLSLRGFKSRTDFYTKLVVITVILYAFLFWLIFKEPGTSITGRAYERFAPLAIWIMPLILYAAQIWDIKNTLRKKE